VKRPFIQYLLALIISVALCACSSTSHNSQTTARIGLVYIGPHELINQIVAGFREGLSEHMAGRPFEIIERHANGDKTQISPTLNGAISSHLDVLATITTPVSQQALKAAPQGLPIVFVGVTDPVGAGLVKSLDRPELSTGVSDVAPLQKILETIKQISPSVKRIGFPYSPEEQPAVYSRRQVEAAAPALGFIIDARPVTSKDELPTLIRNLVRTNDAILVGADNGMFEAAPTIAKTALDGRKPFYSADSSSVKAGAVAAVTVDYKQIGRAGAEVIARVLRGEKAGTIPVKMMAEGVLEVNQTSLTKLGITLPTALLSQVKATYK
jgi:putative tryptophan/tyrosine transport system substrate-binding protein